MTTESVLLRLCLIALYALWAIAIVRGLAECVGMVRRRRSTRRFAPDWWVLLPFFVALALIASDLARKAAPGGFLLGGIPNPFGDTATFAFGLFFLIGETGLIWGVGLFLLVSIPIVQAFRSRAFYWHLYFYGVLGILAMPFGTLAMEVSLEFVSQMAVTYSTGDERVRFTDRYHLEDKPACTLAIMRSIGLQTFNVHPDHYDYRDYPDYEVALIQIWLENTIGAATLDIPQAFGCGFSQLDYDRDDFPMAMTIVLYRIFVSLVVLGMILRPFRVRPVPRAG